MNCHHCGKRLTLLRRLTDGEFCSDVHRRAFTHEQEKLALGRLRDAGRRLTGSPVSEESETAPAEESITTILVTKTDDEVGGFLSQSPLPRSLGGYHRLECEPHATVVEVQLPDREVRWQASPQPVLADAWSPQARKAEIPRRDCTEPVIDFAAMPGRPTGVFQRVECRGIGPAAGQVDWTQKSRQELPGAQMLPGAEWEETVMRPPVAMPFIALDRLPEVAEPGQVEMVQKVQAAEAGLRNGIEVKAEPFTLQPTLTKGDGLARVPDGSLEKADQGDEPGYGELLKLRQPGIAERSAAVRRVRPRELFFPLPRLGHLPSLAAQVADSSVRTVAYQGTNGKRWLPDRVPMSFRLTVADNGRRGVATFEPVEGEASSRLPMIAEMPIPMQAAELRLGGETEQNYLLAGEAYRGAFLPQATVEPLEARKENQPDVPGYAATLPDLGLAASALLSEEVRMARAGVPMKMLESETEGVTPSTPALGLGWTVPVAAASHSIAAIERMLQIRVTIPKGGRDGYAIEPELMEEGPSTPAIAVNPTSRLAGEFALTEENSIFPLHHPLAYSTHYHVTAPGELAPLWADLPKLLPRMAFNVVEDSEMREAARALSAVLAMERSRPWLSGLRMPQVSMQFSRGDLKWLMMSVPVVLLLGVYTLTERGGVGNHLPAVDGEFAEEAVTPASTGPIASAAVGATGKEHATKTMAVEHRPKGAKTAAAVVAAGPVEINSAAHAAEQAQPVGLTPASTRQTSGGSGMMANVRQTILHRAAISMSDDFRSGLGEWEGKGQWSKAWSYDDAGFLRAGPLALYKPSLGLGDYRMEFLGQIEKKSIGWVFRAADTDNYYAMKVIVPDGPLPRSVVEHWAVIGGKETAHVRRPIPFQMQRDSFYRFRMDVAGNGFTLSIQGQVADHWSDDRLKLGGIGFFGVKGEPARLRWVDVSHQYDFLGRLCAFLAPYGLPPKEIASR